MSSAETPRFSDRHARKDRPPSYVERVRPGRDQGLLSFYEPPAWIAGTPLATSHTPGPNPPPTAPATSSGEKAKARDIIAAIRTLKAIESEKRAATTDERGILSRFGGFGPVALSIFPDPVTGRFKPGWQEVGEELKSLLTPEEYDSARRTTFSQFFTSPAVMSAMHAALKRLGVPEQATILEPGCGTGGFLSHASPGQRFIGVELDSISGRIARALHPQADIRIENFRDSKLPPLDAVIGNVPFADVKLDLNGQKLSLHDYFMAKSVDALKPGGVLAVVTSHFTLDKQNGAAREYLASKADFLGAIRLPSNAFKNEGTQVVTDIVFLRKRASGQEPAHADPEWLQTGVLGIAGADLPVNRYFLNHPEMVLGDWSRKDTLYGTGFSVVSNGDLASQLKEAIANLPGGCAQKPPKIPEADDHSHSEAAPKTPPFIPPPPLRHVTEGSFFIGDDRTIYQVEDGKAGPVTYCGVQLHADGSPQSRRIGSLIGLRDLSRRVLQSQNEGWPESARQDARRDLNRAYDRFLSQYGPINKTTFTHTKADGTIRRMPNLVKFREDPDAMLVMSLEEYDEATGRAEKAAIMKKDVVGPKPPVTSVSSAEEGLLVSLDQRGGVELPYIATLYGKPEAEVIRELGDLIYRDPESGKWQTADAYLSGDVRAKLVTAEHAGPQYARNAEALRQVQPEDVLPGDIDANLGAPWIPASDIKAFAEELFGGSFTVGHLKKDAVWSVEPDYRAIQSVAATADYGTPRINGTELLQLAMNMKSPTIYDTISEGGRDIRVVNPEATLAAKEKQRQVKEKFKSWVFSDPDRTERLVRTYNDTYNNLRPRLFDGSHLDFPGMSKAFVLNQHQDDAVWRCMSGGNTLLAHAVGAGKTAECVTAAMKMKQAGLVKKPMVVCPNHMLEQFAREWMQIYPNAKLLVASKEDFTKERRKGLTAKIATGDWDGIIVTHSSFERIGMSSEYQERFLREQIAEYERLLIDKASHGRNIIKTLEKQKASREEKLKNLLAEGKKDTGLVFDELGVDQLFVDECFTYDTLVDTDRGPLKIGDIVTNRLPVSVKSVNALNNAVEWKPVVNWFANKRRNKLVEVVHETGSIRCTPQHKLFTGIVTYRKAGEIEAGEALLVLQESIPPNEQMLGQDVAEILLGRVPDQGQNAHGDMRVVQDPVLLPHARPGQSREASPALLQRELQDESTAGEPGIGSEVPQLHASYMGQPANERQKVSANVGEDERAPFLGRIRREGISRPEGHRSQAEGARRQRAPDRTPNPAGGENRDGDGACHQHEADQTPDGESCEALQSGLGRSGAHARGGVGRLQPQLAESAPAGREEGQSLIPSRVVRVEILEPDGDGEYRFGGRDHSIVYDIEVADNHNYFANGVLVSNCQAYKNMEIPTKMDRVAGISTGGSERAFDLYMKARYLDEKHPGHGLVGASGTPISNSMAEMYTMQKYFDLAGLRSRGIEHFDGWAATFGEVVEAMEISPDGATLKPRSRFAKFINLPELTQMFRAFADVQTPDMLDLPRPALQGGKAHTVACPMSDEQAELQAALVKRYERIRNERVDPREDNALSITTDGRKLALDGRMLGAGRDFEGSKINALVGNVARIWEETAPTRGTQMIFCDMGVNPTPWGFSAYDEVVAKLESRGIPRQQIAVMGDADTDAKKQALFEKVRQGTVRVLIGSTQKMGTGTNVQKRLVALHHLDAPWKPAEVEQREGRILRQGNQNKEVAIYRYVTEGSFDAYMWQALETKARFINQVMSGESGVRKAEDIGGQELSYAEVKAIASGNPAVLTLAEADAELQRLAVLRRNHHDEQYLARRNLRDLPDTINRLSRRASALELDMTTAAAHADDPLIVGGRTVGRKDEMEALTKLMDAVPEKVRETRRFPLGIYHGLKFGMIRHEYGGLDVYLEGAASRKAGMVRENPGPRAVLNAVERLEIGYAHEREDIKADIAVAEGQLRDYEGRIGAEFAHSGYMSELADLRDRLKLGLSEKPPEGGESVSGLAEKIRALRAANTVEAAPERIGARKKVAGETPVTARIRGRRAEAVVEEQPVEAKVTEVKPAAPVEEPTVIALPEPVRSPTNGHSGQVTRRRQGSEAQGRLF